MISAGDLGRDRVQRRAAGPDGLDEVAGVLEIERDERRDRGLVLDDEDRLRGGHDWILTDWDDDALGSPAPNDVFVALDRHRRELPRRRSRNVPVSPTASGSPSRTAVPVPRAEIEIPSPLRDDPVAAGRDRGRRCCCRAARRSCRAERRSRRGSTGRPASGRRSSSEPFSTRPTITPLPVIWTMPRPP